MPPKYAYDFRLVRCPVNSSENSYSHSRAGLNLPYAVKYHSNLTNGVLGMKFMLDTQIYDLVISESGMSDVLNKLSADGKLKILTTHIQRGEIEAIADDAKKQAMQQIVTEIVTTSSAVYGVSLYGMATYGNGGTGGFSIDDIRSKTKRHTKDALIATTAARDADVLVTEDKRLANRLKQLKSRIEVWTFADFKRYLTK
jgi:predicted nucleic acid-binding protein